MFFAIAEDGIVWVLQDEVAAKIAFEAIDVESGVYTFYAEDGTWLQPRFAPSARRGLFGLFREPPDYRLEPAPEGAPEIDPFDVVIAEAVGVEPNPRFRSVAEIRAHVAAVRVAKP